MKQKNHRLNSVSAGTEAVMHVVLALFSLCCIIPFIFGVIISKQVLGLSENYAAGINTFADAANEQMNAYLAG